MYEKWKQEQLARDKLMKEVMKARQEQINEKCKLYYNIITIIPYIEKYELIISIILTK